MKPLRLDELAKIVGGRVIGDSTVTVTGASIDSRSIDPQDLFFAVRGDRCDGHQFVGQALAAGGAACVVRTATRSLEGPQVVVPDPRVALGRFAAWYRQQLQGHVIAITGSVGKTTTRRMIHDVLASEYRATQSPRNFNNDLGLPLSLLAAVEDDQAVVVEIGASAVGEIDKLARIAVPDLAVITDVSASHIEGFGSLSAIRREKLTLLSHMRPDGVGILNGDSEELRAEGLEEVLYFGTSPGSHMCADEVNVDRGLLEFSVNGKRFRLTTVGGHNVYPALAAICVGRQLGVSWTNIQTALRAYSAAPGRGVVTQFDGVTLIDETYNAAPSSMAAGIRALETFRNCGLRIAVLGEMAELGSSAAYYHRDIGRLCGAADIDLILPVGLFAPVVARSAGEKAIPFADIESLNHFLAGSLPSRCAILVKGSRRARMERVVSFLRQFLSPDSAAA